MDGPFTCEFTGKSKVSLLFESGSDGPFTYQFTSKLKIYSAIIGYLGSWGLYGVGRLSGKESPQRRLQKGDRR